MKILHVISDLKPSSGGPSKAVLDMCLGLIKEGHEVAILTTNQAEQGKFLTSHGAKTKVGMLDVSYYPVNYGFGWPISWSLAAALQQEIPKYDIVEIHSLYLFHSMVAAYYCRKFGVPYLIRPHGSLDPYIRNKGRLKKAIYHGLIENRNLNNAAAIHYTAEDEKLLAHEAVGIRAPAIVTTLGVWPKEYSSLPAYGGFRARYPELSGRPIVLFLSRVTQKKGLDLLARAFAEVVKSVPDARLVIAGPEDPGFGERVRGWLTENGVLDRTIFTGMLQGRDKLEAYVDADVFVLPSYSENFGIVLAEAMACRVPVITTNKVNIWREIDEAQAGEIIDCDAEQLAKAILRLLGDKDLRARCGQNGRRLVEEKFNWEVVSKQLVADYQGIIERYKHA